MRQDWSRPDVMSLVPTTAKRILDLGCAGGALGAAIKARQECMVVGVDNDPAAIDAARLRLDGTLLLDLDNLEELGLPGEPYDCVVMADVLEHVRDPQRLLGVAHDHLTPDGTLVVSIPNARHWSVWAALAEGNWTVERAGLRDRSHLRPWTRRELQQALFRAGFAVIDEQGVQGDGYEDWEARGRHGECTVGRLHFSGLSDEEAADCFVYQWLAAAQPLPRPTYGQTTIIVPAYNGLADTANCLSAIDQHTPEDHEVLVVDNGSTDGTSEWLGANGYRSIRLEMNRGFPGGCNAGVAAAWGENVCLLNNDTLVTEGWLGRMLAALYADEKIGAVGPRSNEVGGPQRLERFYAGLEQLPGWAWDWTRAHWTEVFETTFLSGVCLLMRRSTWDAAGGLDEDYGAGLFDDNDISLRLQHTLGLRLMVANAAYVWHAGSSTFKREGIAYNEILVQNQQRFTAKWQAIEAAGGLCPPSQ